MVSEQSEPINSDKLAVKMLLETQLSNGHEHIERRMLETQLNFLRSATPMNDRFSVEV